MAADRTFVYLFAFASIVMVLTFVVVWARNFKQTRQYMPAGLTVVAVLLTFDVTTLLMADGKDPFALSSVTILLVAAMGFGEEITFRLGLQNGLTYLFRSSRFAHYWAVLATAAFWSLGHLGTLEPGWVKLVQVFAIGLVLGQMNRMFGVVPCIITHSTFNVLMVLLAPTVFGHMLEGV